MILIDCNKFNQSASSIREIFIQLCDAELIKLQQHNSLGLMQMTNLFDISKIRSAFRSIYVNNNFQLCTPEQSEYSLILRYLEFGGEDVKPTHLLSNSKKQLFNIFKIDWR